MHTQRSFKFIFKHLSGQDCTRACDFGTDCKASRPGAEGTIGIGVGEAPADFMADFNSVLRLDRGDFSIDFGSGAVSAMDLTIFKADLSSP